MTTARNVSEVVTRIIAREPDREARLYVGPLFPIASDGLAARIWVFPVGATARTEVATPAAGNAAEFRQEVIDELRRRRDVFDANTDH
jgi:hypothetical protein